MDFIKNPNYWDARICEDRENELASLVSLKVQCPTLVEGGEADMTVELPCSGSKRLEEAGLLHIGPMLGNYYYVFNVKAEPSQIQMCVKPFYGYQPC